MSRTLLTQSIARLRVSPLVGRGLASSACAVGSKRASTPYKTLGGGLVLAAGGGTLIFTSDQTRQFSIHSPSESESKITGSSTLLRPASPSAPRRQTVTLVFLTSEGTSQGIVKSVMSNFGSQGTEREKWFSWIGYFREAGYDCLQMNLALSNPSGDVTDKLSDELHSQIRLSNLQRQPVLFVHHRSGASTAEDTAQIVSRYIDPAAESSGGGAILSSIFGGGGMFGKKPALSGLVVVSDLDTERAQTMFAKHPKLNTLIVANGVATPDSKKGKVHTLDSSGKSHEQTIKDIERWLIREGYEG